MTRKKRWILGIQFVAVVFLGTYVVQEFRARTALSLVVDATLGSGSVVEWERGRPPPVDVLLVGGSDGTPAIMVSSATRLTLRSFNGGTASVAIVTETPGIVADGDTIPGTNSPHLSEALRDDRSVTISSDAGATLELCCYGGFGRLIASNHSPGFHHITLTVGQCLPTGVRALAVAPELAVEPVREVGPDLPEEIRLPTPRLPPPFGGTLISRAGSGFELHLGGEVHSGRFGYRPSMIQVMALPFTRYFWAPERPGTAVGIRLDTSDDSTYAEVGRMIAYTTCLGPGIVIDAVDRAFDILEDRGVLFAHEQLIRYSRTTGIAAGEVRFGDVSRAVVFDDTLTIRFSPSGQGRLNVNTRDRTVRLAGRATEIQLGGEVLMARRLERWEWWRQAIVWGLLMSLLTSMIREVRHRPPKPVEGK